jgi:glycosyltransferase involved in cell wall biosynthesis
MAPASKRILAVGMLPPPLGGQALMFQWAAEQLAQAYDVTLIDLQVQKNIGESGSLSLHKVSRLVILTIECLKRTLGQPKYDALYYCPSGPSKIGVLKDLLLLSILRRAARKTVYHFHGTGGMALLHNWGGPLLFWAKCAMFRPDATFRCADVTPNDSALCESRSDIILPNGIPDPFAGDEASPPENLTLSFIGALTKEKGIFDIVEIVHILKNKYPNLVVNLIGEGTGEEVSALDALIDSYNLKDNIIRRGVLAGQAKFDLLRASTLFLFPTFFRAETQPLAVIEALAIGLPAIVSDWRGLRTLIDDGVNGAVLPPQKPEVFAAKIDEIIKSGKLPDMRKAARAMFLARYTAAHFQRNLCKAFDEALKDRNGPS